MSGTKKKDPVPKPSGRVLGVLAACGALSSLWAVFLWTELVAARSGGTPFCGFSGASDCGALWDAAFASTIHRLTGLPVAAWGLVWGLVALLLPLAALANLADGRPSARAVSAVKWTAAAALAGVVALLGASAMEGLFCTSCALTYVLSLAYGALAFLYLAPRGPLRRPGLGTALAATVGAYVLLLYPGLQTPKSLAREEQRVLAQAAQQKAAVPATSDPATTDPAAGDPELERQLEDLLGTLNPQALQAVSNTLAVYRGSSVHQEEPRALQGSPDAPVRITDFTDARCSHCATLHGTLNYIRSLVPSSRFSLDSRQFPLDGNCNNKLTIRGPEDVRCLAARVQICMEDSPHAFEYSGAIFEKQRDLSSDLVYQLAAPHMDRAALEACVASSETARKLAEDVEYAWNFRPTGTPLVLLNGREVPAFGPLIYALVLTGGRADHPAFARLPPPEQQ